MENNFLSNSFSNRPDPRNQSTIRTVTGLDPIPRPLPSQTHSLPLLLLGGHCQPNSHHRASHTLSTRATSMPTYPPVVMSVATGEHHPLIAVAVRLELVLETLPCRVADVQWSPLVRPYRQSINLRLLAVVPRPALHA
jgi:hypothetical protein